MRPRWVMLLYYPAGCDLEMGPTCLLPCGQYGSVDPEQWREVSKSMGSTLGLSEHKCVVSPGACVLIHFHMFHRGSRRLPGAALRPMVKFQYYAAAEPTTAGWEAGPLAQPDYWPDWGEMGGLTEVWDDSLAWMRGGPRGGGRA